MRAIITLSLVVLVLGPAGAQTPAVLHSIGPSFHSFGNHVEAIGDIDADGLGDFLITSSQFSRIHRGAGFRPTDTFYPGPGTMLLRGVGDLDADGTGDLATATPFLNAPNAVNIFSGLNYATIHTVPPTGSLPFGVNVGPIGDIDGSGRVDFFIVYQDTATTHRANCYSGSFTVLLYSVSVIDPQGLSPYGDVDGDGRDEFLVFSKSALQTNQIDVHSGATGAILATVTGPGGNNVGALITPLGDINGDGIPDFATADANGGTVLLFAGGTYASLGIIPRPAGTAATLDWPVSLENCGDMNGDGLPEIAVGATPNPSNCQGSIGGPGEVRIFNVSGVELAHFVGGNGAGDAFGTSLAAPGDLDGDGNADLLIGAPAIPSTATCTGSIGGYAQIVSLRAASVPSLTLSMSATYGLGSLDIRLFGGNPGHPYFTALTLDVFPPTGPGNWFGLTIPPAFLQSELLTPAPPFRGILDGSGSAAWATFLPLSLSGQNLNGVTVTATPGLTAVSGVSSVETLWLQ